jgi:UDP-3-O-[3-hydroxymyristoyl] glucosamine N-acyltransferase
MQITTAALALQLGGEVIGNGEALLSGFSSADQAKAGDLTFAEKDSYFAAAEASAATAILVAGTFTSATKVLIRVPDARIAAAKALPLFFPPESFAPGIDATARIAASAQIDPSAHIGPGCSIGENVSIGARTVLMGGNHLARDCRVGDDVRLSPNVVLYARTEVGHRVMIHAGTVIGSDGYGYVFDQGRHRKILQIGRVIIHNDVEIGANTAIDRGALGPTIIGEGTKIDNLVQIGHNCIIGRHCIIVAECGLSGSVVLEDRVILGGQVGIADHVTIGEGAVIAAKSGVMSNVPAGERWMGYPAMPSRAFFRAHAAARKRGEGG